MIRCFAGSAVRAVDGVAFEREGYGVKVERGDLSPLVQRVQFQYYHNYVDHVMDNFTLRDPPMTMMGTMKMISNPDRLTDGARLAVDLALGSATLVTLGTDWRSDEHTLRKAGSTNGSDPVLGARMDDMSADQAGFFAELDHTVVVSLNAGHRASEHVKLTLGVDNVFDETYAEHLSRAGSDVAGFEPIEKVNEPGRLLWAKATVSF